MTLLRAASLALLGFVAPASAEIVPKCQSLAQHFSEYFTTERANVRDKPSIKGSVVATLPPRTRVYASEEWRVWPRDADSWYILLATEDLPPVRKCAGGYIHPGLISKTRGSEKDVMKGPLYGAIAVAELLYMEAGQHYRTPSVIALNFSSIDAAIRRAKSDCDRDFARARAYDEYNECAVYRVFSTSIRDHSYYDADRNGVADTRKTPGRCGVAMSYTVRFQGGSYPSLPTLMRHLHPLELL